jgi:hypothetical protein
MTIEEFETVYWVGIILAKVVEMIARFDYYTVDEGKRQPVINYRLRGKGKKCINKKHFFLHQN